MPTPSALYVQAMQLFSRGAYPQAIGLLQKVVASHPSQIEPRLQLAKACLDWVQLQARTPLTEVEPDSLNGDAAHYLQLGVSQVNALEKTHPASPHVQSLLAMVHLVGVCQEGEGVVSRKGVVISTEGRHLSRALSVKISHFVRNDI